MNFNSELLPAPSQDLELLVQATMPPSCGIGHQPRPDL